jgi:hypothetical protein
MRGIVATTGGNGRRRSDPASIYCPCLPLTLPAVLSDVIDRGGAQTLMPSIPGDDERDARRDERPEVVGPDVAVM